MEAEEEAEGGAEVGGVGEVGVGAEEVVLGSGEVGVGGGGAFMGAVEEGGEVVVVGGVWGERRGAGGAVREERGVVERES